MAVPASQRSSPDRESNSFAVLHAESQTSAGAKKEFAKRLTNSFKPPIEVARDDLADYVSCLLNACANGKPLIDLINMAATIVEAGFGTHTTKFPNTNIVVSEAALFGVMPRSSVGAVSSNTLMHRKYLCAGNASDIPAQRLLSAVCVLDDTLIHLADDIADQGPLYREMEKLVSSDSLINLSNKIQTRLANPSRLESAVNKNEKHGGVPTFFWPIDSECQDFHLLSAVTSVPMIAEVRTRELADDLKFGERQIIKVGGAQPQNAGLLAMDHAGFVFHFSSFPPIGLQKPKLNISSGFKALSRLVDDEGKIVRNNLIVKQAQRNVVEWIVDKIIDYMQEPPSGDPVTPTVTKILNIIEKSARIQQFVMWNTYQEMFKDAASGHVAAFEGLI
jgi:hypothetical protein